MVKTSGEHSLSVADDLALQQAKEKKNAVNKNVAKDVESHISLTQTKLSLGDLQKEVESAQYEHNFLSSFEKKTSVSLQKSSELVSHLSEKLLILEQQHLSSLLPEAYRVTAKEYIHSFSSPQKKQLVLEKIDKAFDILYMQTCAENTFPARKSALFSRMLHRSKEQQQISLVHDTYIDMKYSLLS